MGSLEEDDLTKQGGHGYTNSDQHPLDNHESNRYVANTVGNYRMKASVKGERK